MTTEEEIQSLLADAAPLRALDPDDPAAGPLAGIVDRINVLRAKQDREKRESWIAEVNGANLGREPEPVKRGPGRPKKEA